MSEQQPNEPMSFSRFADWCRHIDSLSEGARHTVKVLLNQAGTDDAEAAEQILSSMTELDLRDNQITDISSLGSLTNLTTLILRGCCPEDFSSLGLLTNLTTLYLDCICIYDISFLDSLTNLTTLILDRNQIHDISSLGSLTNLTTLDLGRNYITDISSLGSLTNLTTLDLRENGITDISSLASLTNLTTLYLGHNRISDFSALRGLVNLTTLDLDHNSITYISLSSQLEQKRRTLLTKPIDVQKATAAVKLAYAAIGLAEPKVIVCSSPRDAFFQIFNLPKHYNSQNYSDKWRWKRSGEKLDWKWMSPSIVKEFANPLVWQSELDRVVFESELDIILSSLMNELVNEYEAREVIMGNIFPNHLFSLAPPETSTTLLKEIYLAESYISKSGINLSQKAQEIVRCQKLLFEHCGLIFRFEKICVVCDRPRHLRFDSENRLHAEAEPAIEFADGYKLYYYHGV